MQRADWAAAEALTRVVRSILRRQRGAPLDLSPFSLQVNLPTLGAGTKQTFGTTVTVPARFDFLWCGLSARFFSVWRQHHTIRAFLPRLNRYLGTGARSATGQESIGWMYGQTDFGTGQLPRLFPWPILLHGGDNVIWDQRIFAGGGDVTTEITLIGYSVFPPTRAVR